MAVFASLRGRVMVTERQGFRLTYSQAAVRAELATSDGVGLAFKSAMSSITDDAGQCGRIGGALQFRLGHADVSHVDRQAADGRSAPPGAAPPGRAPSPRRWFVGGICGIEAGFHGSLLVKTQSVSGFDDDARALRSLHSMPHARTGCVDVRSVPRNHGRSADQADALIGNRDLDT